MSPKILAIATARRIAIIVSRYRQNGWRSGTTCLKIQFLNIYRRIENLFGPKRVACPCCGWHGYGFRYVDCGVFMVPDAECPRCRGHERHRLLQMFLMRRRPKFMQVPGTVLHFAPEHQVRSAIEETPGLKPISTDWNMYKYDDFPPSFHADIHAIPAPSNTFNGVYCLHVLEHVKDDIQAIQEIYRVLKRGGQAVIMVPFMMGQPETEEYDAPDLDNWEHMRGYSPLDFKFRLKPFNYEEIMPADLMTPEEIEEFQVPDSQAVYLCTKK